MGCFTSFGIGSEKQPFLGLDKLGSAMATKEATVAELQKQFEESSAVLLTEYRGLTVGEMRELRNSIREHATYAVSKNTLTKIAANKAGITDLDEHLSGPTAIAFIHGDAVAVAKGLRDFAKANPLLVVKAGRYDGKPLTAAEVGEARRSGKPRGTACKGSRRNEGFTVRCCIPVQRPARTGRSRFRCAA